jgi:small conductance mechanosensitive channel
MLVRAVRFAALILAWGIAAQAPVPAQILTGAPAASAAPELQAGLRQEGIYTTAPVTLDGAVLFRVAALQNQSPDQLSLSLRQSYIETALGEAIATTGTGGATATVYDPTSLIVRVRRDGAQAELEIVDRKHADPLPILTVNSVDARYHQLSLSELATQWQGILQAALEQALLKRQPAIQRASLITVAQVFAALVVLTLLAAAGIAVLRRRIRALEREVAETKPEAPAAEPGDEPTSEPRNARRIVLAALRNRLPSERLALLHGAIGVSIFVVLLLWLVATTWALSLFPQTTPLAHVVARRAIAVVAIWIFAGLAIRILDVAITRWAAWQFGTFASADERSRALLRGPTISSSVSGFSRFSVTFLAVLLALSQVGIPVGSVVTIGGVAAIAVTFAAQNFVRDFIGGFLVLFEDQYVVGDYITVNGTSGLVENLSLRMVQIRDTSQNLITIAHGSVAMVRNESRYWSGLDYTVSIEQQADALKAMELLKAAIEPPAVVEWIGLDALDRDYVTIRASIKTGPLQQFQLRRDLNERVYRAYREAGIPFGAPPAPPA